eukprot:2407285-Rhodomonas_salina.1
MPFPVLTLDTLNLLPGGRDGGHPHSEAHVLAQEVVRVGPVISQHTHCAVCGADMEDSTLASLMLPFPSLFLLLINVVILFLSRAGAVKGAKEDASRALLSHLNPGQSASMNVQELCRRVHSLPKSISSITLCNLSNDHLCACSRMTPLVLDTKARTDSEVRWCQEQVRKTLSHKRS